MTIDEVILALCSNTARGSPKRAYEVMTPSRYAHATELLQKGVPAEVVLGAVNRINASSWLKRPVGEIGESELEEARRMAEHHLRA